jgi:hypothetical protein
MKSILSLIAPLALVCLLALPAQAGVPYDIDMRNAIEDARQSGVSDLDLTRMLALGVRHELSMAEMNAYLDRLRAAADEELPCEPLVAKAAEGLLKNVPQGRILAVLDDRIERYRSTRALLAETGRGDDISPMTLARLADSMSAGITRDELAAAMAVSDEASLGEICSAVEFMASCKQSDLDPNAAVKLAAAGIEGGVFRTDGFRLARAVAAAKQQNRADEDIVATLLPAMQGRISPTELARAMGLPEGADDEAPKQYANRADAPDAGGDPEGDNGSNLGAKGAKWYAANGLDDDEMRRIAGRMGKSPERALRMLTGLAKDRAVAERSLGIKVSKSKLAFYRTKGIGRNDMRDKRGSSKLSSFKTKGGKSGDGLSKTKTK